MQMVSVRVPLSEHSLYRKFTKVTYCCVCEVAESVHVYRYMSVCVCAHMCSLKCCQRSKQTVVVCVSMSVSADFKVVLIR